MHAELNKKVVSRRGFACVTTSEAERLSKTDLDIAASFSRSVFMGCLGAGEPL